VKYCDIMSLYPYICKYSKFPTGHPIIHICKNIVACLQMEGPIKCTVVPPKDLFHPLLPYRSNKKLLFCLCRTCDEKQNLRGPCQHFSDAERAISGTWVLDELRLALTKVTNCWKFTRYTSMLLHSTIRHLAREGCLLNK